MKPLRVTLIGLALVLALIPEFTRYLAEHRLYWATSLFRSAIVQGKATTDHEELLETVVTSATDSAASLPGDSRPWILAGSARLFAGRPAEALALYRLALNLGGERAEIDLNLGRAYDLLGNQSAASAAILRAAWVSPAIISSLPNEVQEPVRAVLALNSERLRAHRLSAPPPLPAAEKN
jgi:cytochrome c-type biogenesis protein CcmH/NrfG